MESELLKALAAQGCGVEESLNETYMGNEAFYEKILHKLPANSCMTRMREAIDAQDAKALFLASHELKGLYGTMGLTPLFKLCCDIVEPARAGSLDGVEAHYADLKVLHANTCDLINSFPLA